MSIGINTTPLSPEEIDARLALGILEQRGNIGPEQAKQELRTIIEKSGEMYGVVAKAKDLDRRVEVAITRAINCLEVQSLDNKLRENSGYRPSFMHENERTSTFAKTIPNKTVDKILMRNWIQLKEGITEEKYQRIEKNVVTVSQLWTNLKQNVEKDIESEVRKLVGNASFEFTRKKRIEKLYSIMRLSNDPNAILKQISKANRPIAARFPEVCKAHVESCGEILRENLTQGMSWGVALSKYEKAMKELNNKLNFLSQAEAATIQPVARRSLEKATDIKNTTASQVQTIDRALHQVMREIHTWSDGIQLNGEPFKITTLIQILDIPLNEKCKTMAEDELAEHLASSNKGFVDEKGWKGLSNHAQKSILQHLFCFTATMIDTVSIQTKFGDLKSDEYRVQISQSKGLEEEERNRELYRPYTGNFTLKRSGRNASGFEITGVMEKTYVVVLLEDVGNKQNVGTVRCLTEIDSNKESENQVMYRLEQLQKANPS